MEVKLLEESGLRPALLGMRLSRRSRSDSTMMDGYVDVGEEDLALAQSLISLGDDHAVAMRMVNLYFSIRATRYWWAQMDRYAVGTDMVSDSTMYNIRAGVTKADFSKGVDENTIDAINGMINHGATVETIKQNLPEGYLQSRIMRISAQTMRRIWLQRRNHKLNEWQEFLSRVRAQISIPELIFVEPRNDE